LVSEDDEKWPFVGLAIGLRRREFNGIIPTTPKTDSATAERAEKDDYCYGMELWHVIFLVKVGREKERWEKLSCMWRERKREEKKLSAAHL
jgi:hypothetical protein